MTLGERIKEHRNRLSYSQEKIAEMVGVSRQAVTKWESDQTIPCMENLITLADIYGITLGELSGTGAKAELNLRTVKSSWRAYGRITLTLGLSLLAVSLVMLIISFAIIEADLFVWFIVLGINGTVWLILGIIFSAFAKYGNDKLKRLKSEGICYAAKVGHISRNNYWIRMGSMLSGFAECYYINQEGQKCRVKSSSFLLEEQFADYNVSVYVNPVNPLDYALEISVSVSTY